MTPKGLDDCAATKQYFKNLSWIWPCTTQGLIRKYGSVTSWVWRPLTECHWVGKKKFKHNLYNLYLNRKKNVGITRIIITRGKNKKTKTHGHEITIHSPKYFKNIPNKSRKKMKKITGTGTVLVPLLYCLKEAVLYRYWHRSVTFKYSDNYADVLMKGRSAAYRY
jgi:hypothetical protein